MAKNDTTKSTATTGTVKVRLVKGLSAKGTATIDTFSLKGLAQALDRLAQDCRR